MYNNLRILTSVYGVYGSNMRRERAMLLPKLLEALSANAVLLGDFNGTMSPFDTMGAAMGRNAWKWFKDKENDSSLTDTFKVFCGSAHPGFGGGGGVFLKGAPRYDTDYLPHMVLQQMMAKSTRRFVTRKERRKRRQPHKKIVTGQEGVKRSIFLKPHPIWLQGVQFFALGILGSIFVGNLSCKLRLHGGRQ